MPEYVSVGGLEPSGAKPNGVSLAVCLDCAAVVVDDREHANRSDHNRLHQKVEKALRIAEGPYFPAGVDLYGEGG